MEWKTGKPNDCLKNFLKGVISGIEKADSKLIEFALVDSEGVKYHVNLLGEEHAKFQEINPFTKEKE